LKAIRKKIKDSPLDASLLSLIKNKMKAKGKWTSYRFRSSTNAEDIPGFNGAGLYTSKTGSLIDTAKPIDKAVKSVWASLWSLRAFQERSFFGLDQSKVFMGILCHRNFGDEEANGVVVTKNLYRDNYPGMVVNIQIGETSIVLPSDSISCEQLLVTMPIDADDSDENIGIDHIAFSSLSPSKNIMTNEEMVRLSRFCKAIKSHFYFNKNRFTDQSLFDKYGMDIEFKLEKRTRKLYIKQAREY
jgi:pyruvate, water dikinase